MATGPQRLRIPDWIPELESSRVPQLTAARLQILRIPGSRNSRILGFQNLRIWGSQCLRALSPQDPRTSQTLRITSPWNSRLSNSQALRTQGFRSSGSQDFWASVSQFFQGRRYPEFVILSLPIVQDLKFAG